MVAEPRRRQLAWGWIVADLVGILFSSAMILFVVVRALQLDASRPWFEPPPSEPAAAPEPVPARPGRRTTRPTPIRSRRARGTSR